MDDMAPENLKVLATSENNYITEEGLENLIMSSQQNSSTVFEEILIVNNEDSDHENQIPEQNSESDGLMVQDGESIEEEQTNTTQKGKKKKI